MALIRSLTIDRQPVRSPNHSQAAAMVSWQQRLEEARQEAADSASQQTQAEANKKIAQLEQKLAQREQAHQQELLQLSKDYEQRWSQALAVLSDIPQQRKQLLVSSEREMLDLALHCCAVILQHEVHTDQDWYVDILRGILAQAVAEDHSELLVSADVAAAIAEQQHLFPPGHRVTVHADPALEPGELRLRNGGTEWNGGLAQAWQRIVEQCNERRTHSLPEAQAPYETDSSVDDLPVTSDRMANDITGEPNDEDTLGADDAQP